MKETGVGEGEGGPRITLHVSVLDVNGEARAELTFVVVPRAHPVPRQDRRPREETFSLEAQECTRPSPFSGNSALTPWGC